MDVGLMAALWEHIEAPGALLYPSATATHR
jgi:hypothetical protein